MATVSLLLRSAVIIFTYISAFFAFVIDTLFMTTSEISEKFEHPHPQAGETVRQTPAYTCAYSTNIHTYTYTSVLATGEPE